MWSRLSVCVAVDVAVDVAFDVAFDFDLRGPHLNPPENLAKNGSVSNFVRAEGEFSYSPIFRQIFRGFGFSWGRLFWVTFFGGAKKVTGCRATPDLLNFK